MRTCTRRRIKSLSALTGVSAVIVMGLAAVAQDQERTDIAEMLPPPPGVTIGQTTTEAAVPPSVAPTSIARPALRAQRPRGY